MYSGRSTDGDIETDQLIEQLDIKYDCAEELNGSVICF